MARRGFRGMYISKWALREHFDPREYPRETYLLCELEWGRSSNFWQHWVRNDNDNDRHAEEYFLENIFEPRNNNFCNITWYLSWSPCPECCQVIQDFLETHHNVNIDIRVARLYYSDTARNHQGLRELDSSQGVTIDVMEEEDYEYCWETFIAGDVSYDFTPVDYRLAIWRNRLKLRTILTGLHY
ncbi:C-_U-editing enzyme APOBEC-1-like isoform X1 [Cyanistes caeruleus]|uniref:C->U-editing enzyme APOBEC-1-like isoform X1 n=1 Tax=Cyanistes caeruleus TaxID=156563 RepID=UPI000CDA68C5|nr:C->U-editing enzyme APOBEC-1-like isoform X1 [Cyanistes caeruleus]